jgi:TRAP-type C4-dicarboxylate transport system permease small subunit
MKKADEVFVKISRTLNDISGFVLFVIICFVFCHVLLRAALNMPIPGIVEIVQYGIFAVVILGLSNNELEGGNIVVTFLTDRMKPKTSNLFSIIMYIVATIMMAIITWNQFGMISQKLHDGYYTTILKIPHWILMIILVIGLFVMVLSCIIKVIRMLNTHKKLSVKVRTAEELALQMDIKAEF